MKLKLNISTNKTLRNKNNKDIFSRIFDNNKNNNIKNINRQNLSGDNFPLNKNNNENINLLNINNYSILEYNNINKEKNKKKRTIHSASILRSRNISKKDDNKYPNVIYNIKHIHQFVTMIEKKYNLLNEISKDNIYNTNYFFHSKFSRNILNINKNNNEYDLNKYYTNANIKKNNELIPYPFKRLQNKIRKYFALSKIKTNFNYNSNNNKEINKEIIKLPEEQIASGYNFHNKYLLKIGNLKENKYVRNKKEVNNKFRNKIFKSGTYNGKKILKKDKSVSTENILLKRNNDNKKINSLFNNKLLASLTSYSENRFFLTTGDKNKKNESSSSRSILVYHKNY
jgi:hypothetical protein